MKNLKKLVKIAKILKKLFQHKFGKNNKCWPYKFSLPKLYVFELLKSGKFLFQHLLFLKKIEAPKLKNLVKFCNFWTTFFSKTTNVEIKFFGILSLQTYIFQSNKIHVVNTCHFDQICVEKFFLKNAQNLTDFSDFSIFDPKFWKKKWSLQFQNLFFELRLD